MGKIVARNYRGTRDWLGSEVYLRQEVINTLREVFEEFGFEPLETPEIELQEVLLGKYGPEGDELSYYFKKGDDWLGLRYDHTVPLARVVAQHEKELVFPYKRYAIGPVFRADEPQAGRYRRFIQCDFDIVGVAEPIADAEIVVLTYTALRRLGFDKFEIQLNDRRLLNGIAKASGAERKELTLAFLRSWDKLEKVSREQISRELKEKGASPELISRFFTVIKEAGIGSITGGGRYDNLIEALGGPSLPATGSSFGLERIILVMKKAIQFAGALRQEGIKTELSMVKGLIGRQLRIADRHGIPVAVFAGPKEVKKGTVIVKDLTTPFTGEKKYLG